MTPAHGLRRALVAAAITVAVLAAVLTLALAARHPAAHTPTPSPSPAPGSPPVTDPVGTGMPQIPDVSLTGLRWADFHGVGLPSSPAAGPRDASGGLASGFADTPLGALLAALNIGVRANALWGPAIFGPTIENQVTGADQPALLAACQSGYAQASQSAHVSGGKPLGNAYVSEEAFRWVAYTPADATLDLVTAGPGSGGETVQVSTQVEVVWAGRDWRVIAPPGGDWGNSARQLASLAGYTSFPGQR